MSTTTICRDAFDHGQDLRRQSPFNSGRYNIEEAAKQLSDLRRTLDGIAEITCRRGFYPERTHLPCCLPSERAIFLKNVPYRICLLLGHDILPSIAALHGDGVSAGDVQTLRAFSDRAAKGIISSAQGTHNLLQSGIQSEYGAQLAGESYLNSLFDDTEDLIRAALEAVPAQPA